MLMRKNAIRTIRKNDLLAARPRERKLIEKNGAFTIVSRPINVPWKINMHRFVPKTRCLLQIWNSLV